MTASFRRKKKKKIFERDGGICLCCGSTNNLTLDHVIPKSLGGINKAKNLQTLCFWCNTLKGSRIINYRKNSNSVLRTMKFKVDNRI